VAATVDDIADVVETIRRADPVTAGFILHGDPAKNQAPPPAFNFGGKVYLIADRIGSLDAADATLVHEMLGHAGAYLDLTTTEGRTILGDLMASAGSLFKLAQLANAYRPGWSDLYVNELRAAADSLGMRGYKDPLPPGAIDQPTPELARYVSEVLAAYTESRPPSASADPTLVQKLKEALGAALAAIRRAFPLLGKLFDMTDLEMAALVARSRNALKDGVVDKGVLDDIVSFKKEEEQPADPADKKVWHNARWWVSKGEYLDILNPGDPLTPVTKRAQRYWTKAKETAAELLDSWVVQPDKRKRLHEAIKTLPDRPLYERLRIALQNSKYEATKLQQRIQDWVLSKDGRADIKAAKQRLQRILEVLDEWESLDDLESAKKLGAVSEEDYKEARAVLATHENLRGIDENMITTFGDFNSYLLDDVHTLTRARVDAWVTHQAEPLRRNLFHELRAFARAAGLATDQAMQNLSAYLYAKHAEERNRVNYYMRYKADDPEIDGRRDRIISNVQDGTVSPQVGWQQLVDLVDQDAGTNWALEKYEQHGSGMSQEQADEIINRAKDQGWADTFDKLGDYVYKLADLKLALDEDAGKLGERGRNVMAFYDFKNYVPLKNMWSKDNPILGEHDFELTSDKPTSRVDPRMVGRQELADNTVAQVLQDLDYAIDGAVAQRVASSVFTHVLAARLNQKYAEMADGMWKTSRLRFGIPIERLWKEPGKYDNQKGMVRIRPDGKFDYVQFADERGEQAANGQVWKSVLFQKLGYFTSFIGSMHTFWRPAFWPKNLWREWLNAGITMAAEFDRSAAIEAMKRAPNPFTDAHTLFQYMLAYERGDEATQLKLRDTTRAGRLAYEFIREGGRVSFRDALSAYEEVERARKVYRADRLGDVQIMFEKMYDVVQAINDVTDLSARLGVFDYLVEEKGWSRRRAAAFTKNLANFEQRGKYGGAIGGLFMFFRAGATGGFRALDALLKGENGAETAALMVGVGMALYMMSYAMSPEDDDGEKLILKDKMNRWATGARFYFLGDKEALVIPFPLGVGSAIAFGTQLAGLMAGHQSVGEMIQTTGQIMIDNFSPIAPASGDNAWKWAIQTATPTAFRGVTDLAVNASGLGIPIEREGAFGDPLNYTAGTKANVGSAGERIATLVYKATGYDLPADKTQYLIDTYFDAIEDVYAMGNEIATALSSGGAEVTDWRKAIPFIAGFTGKIAQRDAAQFYEARDTITQRYRMVKALADSGQTEQAQAILDENPGLIQAYQEINKVVRGMQDWSRVRRHALVNTEMPLAERRQLIEQADQQRRSVMAQYLQTPLIQPYLE